MSICHVAAVRRSRSEMQVSLSDWLMLRNLRDGSGTFSEFLFFFFPVVRVYGHGATEGQASDVL